MGLQQLGTKKWRVAGYLSPCSLRASLAVCLGDMEGWGGGQLGFLPTWQLREIALLRWSLDALRWITTYELDLESYVLSLPLYSIGQNSYQSLFSFKTKGHRPHLPQGECQKICKCISKIPHFAMWREKGQQWDNWWSWIIFSLLNSNIPMLISWFWQM